MPVIEALDLSADRVLALLWDAYGLRAEQVVPIDGEASTVCRVTVGQRRYAVKAMAAPGDAAAAIAWRTDAMVTLARAGLPVPTLHPDLAGRVLHPLQVDDSPVLVQLGEWLADPPLSQVQVDHELCRQVGATAAAVHLALRSVGAPPVPVGHPWELTRTAESLRTALPAIDDDELRKLGEEVATDSEHRLLPALAAMPQVVLHHDLHDSNVLVGVDADGRRRIIGVLDFDDMVVGPRIAELAVAGAYAARNAADPAGALLEVATGWMSALALTEDEISAYLPAAIGRLAVNACVWAARAHGPRAAYARVRSASSARALAELRSVECERFEDVLRDRLWGCTRRP